MAREIPKIMRLDHHGIVAGLIDEIEMVSLIDDTLGHDEQELVSSGMAVKAMIMNGLGFSSRPLTLTPQFFDNLPMEHLFGEGVKAEHFNRHKLGRVLDRIYESGSTQLFTRIANAVTQANSIDTSVLSLDSTSFSFYGDYSPTSICETDDELEPKEVHITHGFSKAHRPDLKQVVVELLVTQDGGIPYFMKTHDGNASDNVLFKERVKAIVEGVKEGDGDCIIIADSKLYTKKAAPWLKQIRYITRIPATNTQVKALIDTAIERSEAWTDLGEGYRSQAFSLTHHDIKQRWIVIHSEAAHARKTKTIERAAVKEMETIRKRIKHLGATQFSCEADAKKTSSDLVKTLKLLRKVSLKITSKNHYARRGKPTSETPVERVSWRAELSVEIDTTAVSTKIDQQSTFVLGTNIEQTSHNDLQILETYKAQSVVERGFRFLKEPSFFTSAFFLKKPSRVEALMVVMTLSMLIYSLAQRRMRASLKQEGRTVPNQINKQISTPTLRWVFQLFEGINLMEFPLNGEIERVIDGYNEVRQTIIDSLGETVQQVYSDFSVRGCSM